MPTLESLQRTIQDLTTLVHRIYQPANFVFDQDVKFTKRIIGGIYSGVVNTNGAAIHLPPGWTSTKNSTGHYTVTHNLGTTNYAVVPGALTGDAANSDTQSATSFTVITTGAGSVSDFKFSFMLMLY